MTTMDADFVRTLITHGREDPSLEWKEMLNIHDKAGKAELVRDMLSLVNAHGSGSRYLLIGVRNDGTVAGVQEQVDDATLQQIVNSRVEPPIEFRTTYVAVDAATIGVIEIASSSKRFHVVSRDLQGNDGPHLLKGHTWIKKGSSKGPPDAWDYARLREAVAEQSVPQPIIRASFMGNTDEVTVSPSWDEPDRRPVEHRFADPLAGLGRAEDPPPGTAKLQLIVWNDGEQGAEDVRVFVDLPEGCKAWEPRSNPPWTMVGPAGPVAIWVDESRSRLVMRAEKLTHGLHTQPMSADVTFPGPDGAYELTWSGHASNMRKRTAGVLRVRAL